jgi:PAS domain S-box-containing protein
VQDVSARKEAEERLRFQAHMLDSAGEAIVATDAEGVAIYLNRHAELLFGWPKEEALGRNIIDLLLPVETAERAKSMDVMAELRAGKHASGDYFLKRRDGSAVRVSISISVVRDEAGAVEALIGISRDVTEISRAREQLVQSEGRLRGLTARLENSREEERTRIARAIHDELGQLLTGLKMDLRWVEGWLEKSDDVRLRPFLDRIVGSTELTDAMIKAVQGIAADLRPGVLDALGLASALDFEARRFQERTGTPCTVEHPEEMPPLSADVTTSLFRIFQECLTNVARHSAATEVDVMLKPDGDEVILCVADNGRGMRDIDRVAVESLGLLGITERVKLLGGNVSFSSVEERGTTVVVRLPQRSQVAYGAE